MSAEIKSALVSYNSAMDALEDAEKSVQVALQNIKTVAKVATIEVDGQFFQVRERRGKLYLCELNGKPKGRPVGSKKKRPEGEAVATESVAPESIPPESAVPEITGVHRIDSVEVESIISAGE